MKPIKRGMTEAVTRDGRKVTHLTWFDDVNCGTENVVGILDGEIRLWYANGNYFKDEAESTKDIFAPFEYEWQWLKVKNDDKTCFEITSHFSNEQLAKKFIQIGWNLHSRIEESKREVK